MGSFSEESAESGGDSRPLDDETGYTRWWPVRVPEFLGTLVVFGLTALVITGVGFRVSGRGLVGSVELASFTMLVMVALGISSLSFRDEHVRLDAISMATKGALQTALSSIGDILQLVIAGILTFALVTLFLADLESGTTVGGQLRMDRSWLSGVAAAGFLMVVIVMLRNLGRRLLFMAKRGNK